jgi:hypothetical protein
MPSIRKLVVSMMAALAGSVLFAAGCGAGGIVGACHDFCDKQYSCGDIDSVKADQCANKCDAEADVNEAIFEGCINQDDMLSATSECLGRACSDYAKCLNTIPTCKTAGGSGGSSNEATGGGG